MNTSPKIDMAGTGRLINQLRIDAGMSVRDIQTILGLGSTQAIYKWLAGKGLPSIDNLVVLSSVLNVSLDDLIVRS
ncbi:helix-turn-helix domain-containing protein [Candidatus Allofournierella merdipullorum]|uniref:helix-turn-helix domain-containing protein n=1 Tax=Candidatus Allofournierella merdipullorum TaxID=2838595 RepID=UPI00374EC599